MNKKEIEKKASEYSRQQVKPLEKINHTQVGLAMYANDIAVAFEAGAEWMQSELTARAYHALENILSKQVLDGLVNSLKEE